MDEDRNSLALSYIRLLAKDNLWIESYYNSEKSIVVYFNNNATIRINVYCKSGNICVYNIYPKTTQFYRNVCHYDLKLLFYELCSGPVHSYDNKATDISQNISREIYELYTYIHLLENKLDKVRQKPRSSSDLSLSSYTTTPVYGKGNRVTINNTINSNTLSYTSTTSNKELNKIMTLLKHRKISNIGGKLIKRKA